MKQKTEKTKNINGIDIIKNESRHRFDVIIDDTTGSVYSAGVDIEKINFFGREVWDVEINLSNGKFGQFSKSETLKIGLCTSREEAHELVAEHIEMFETAQDFEDFFIALRGAKK